MQYKEYAPGPALTPIVHCVWTLDGHARELSESQPILPDGRPEIILHLGDPFDREWPEGRQERQSELVFAGQLRGPLVLRPVGHVAVVGIRLQPHGAAALIDMPQQELTGHTIGIRDLSPRLARALAAVRGRADSTSGIAMAVSEVLTRHVDPHRVDRRVRAAVEQIARYRGLVTVDRLAAHVNMTPRHLERRFKAVVGLSPKRLARIARFQRALRLFEQNDSPPRGTATAAMCGYADQAHFIRDFRELAGCSPGSHLMRQAELNGFFAAGASQILPARARTRHAQSPPDHVGPVD